jgi:hypothetical protein
MLGDVRDPIRVCLADDQPEQPSTLRQRPDRVALFWSHATRDESLQHPIVRTDDAEGCVPRADERSNPLDDQLEGIFDIEDAGDRTGSLVDGLKRACVE